MAIELDGTQARVLGSLMEKSWTTPDLYPLTMNGLVLACNQKSSRDPVMTLDEAEVGRGLHALIEKSLAGRLHEPGGRVPKFMHHGEMLVSGADDKILALLCVLLLRGPQTAGELKTRTERMHRFESVAEVESLLQDLAAREAPCVAKTGRRAGQKEDRWRHLFGGEAPETAEPETPLNAPIPAKTEAPGPSILERLEALEKRVAALEAKGDSPSENAPAAE